MKQDQSKTGSASTVHTADGLGINRRGDALLCTAWGETDRPDAFIARTLDEVKRFLVTEWLGDGDNPNVVWILEQLAEHDWDENGELLWELEMGGVQLQDVVAVMPNSD